LSFAIPLASSTASAAPLLRQSFSADHHRPLTVTIGEEDEPLEQPDMTARRFAGGTEDNALLCGMTAVTTASSEPRAAPKRRTLKNIGQGIDYSEEKQGMAMMAQR